MNETAAAHSTSEVLSVIEGAEVVEILSDRVKLRHGVTVFTLTY